MEYSHNTAAMQPNPNPIFSYNLNSNPYQPTALDPHNALYHHYSRPSGVDPSHVPPLATVPYTQYPARSEPQQGAASTAAAYYQDPNAAYYYQDSNGALYYQAPNASWPAAVTQLGTTSFALGVATTNPVVQTQKRNTWKKVPKIKKTKIVQSAWCEVCKIDCNSKGVLDQHKLGKKHKKNLEILKAKFTVVPLAVPPAPKPAVGPDKNPAPIIGPKENPEKPSLSNSQKARKKAANARTEDLETKRRRVVEGGAAADGVRACNICNVVCNSDTVFRYHLAGQKHASMFKKYVSGLTYASAV